MLHPQIGNTWNAKLYDDAQNFIWKFGTNVVDLLDPLKGENILDLGSGTGHLAAQIAERGAHVVGIDGSAAMVAEAKAGYPTLRFFHVDARTLVSQDLVAPEAAAAELLNNAQYDAVFSNATLHWIPDAESVIRGVGRLLKAGGRFVAEMGGRGNVSKVHAAIAAARAKLGYDARPSVLFFPALSRYATLLEANGFEVVSMQLFDRPTALQGEHGLAEWALSLARNEIDDIPARDIDAFNAELERIGRAELHDGTQWIADYRRLRFVAKRL